MALFTNRIYFGPGANDYFAFDDLQGIPRFRSEKLELLTRPGKSDHSFRKTGTRGEAFQLRAVRYVDDRPTALEATAAYEGTLDGNRHRVIQHDEEIGHHVVVNIEYQPLQAVSGVVGSITTNPQIKLVSIWTLFNVEEPEP